MKNKKEKDEEGSEGQKGGVWAAAPSSAGQLEVGVPAASILPGSQCCSHGSLLFSHFRRSQPVHRRHSFQSCPL